MRPHGGQFPPLIVPGQDKPGGRLQRPYLFGADRSPEEVPVPPDGGQAQNALVSLYDAGHRRAALGKCPLLSAKQARREGVGGHPLINVLFFVVDRAGVMAISPLEGYASAPGSVRSFLAR